MHFGGVSSLFGELYNETMCLMRNTVYVEKEVPVVSSELQTSSIY